MFQLWSIVFHPWSAVFQPWSTTYRLWSTVFRLWSAVFQPWSAVFQPWSTVFRPSFDGNARNLLHLSQLKGCAAPSEALQKKEVQTSVALMGRWDEGKCATSQPLISLAPNCLLPSPK